MPESGFGNLLPSQVRAIDAALQRSGLPPDGFRWEMQHVDWEQTYQVPTVVHVESRFTFGIDYHDAWADGYGGHGAAAFVVRHTPGIQSGRDEKTIPLWDKVLERFSLWLNLVGRELGTPDVIAPTSPDEPSRSPLSPIWSLLHPDIVAVARRRFESGHFADAVEASLKHVNELLQKVYRDVTGEDEDGSKLMKRLFSVGNPILKFGDLSTDTGRSMQVGYMEIFSGAMTGVRNPKAHANVIIDQRRAIHFLFLASLLRDKIDEAERTLIRRRGT